MVPMQSKLFFVFFRGGGVGPEIVDLLAASRPNPALGRAWERPRPGPRSSCTDVQPGEQILRPFRGVFEPPCDCIGDGVLTRWGPDIVPLALRLIGGDLGTSTG